jgi:hypothetical protein
MPRLEFDEEKHLYTLDGRRLVSVTEALGLVDDRRKTDPWYLQRGRLVHLACEYYDKNQLDESTVDIQIRPYIDAYVKFRKDTDFEPIHIEHPLYHPSYFYAGKPDRIGPLYDAHVIIDLKSGAKSKVDELQGAAYFELCRANNIPVKKVFDLYLSSEGTYKLEPIENPKRLLPTFLNVLGAYRYKENL